MIMRALDSCYERFEKIKYLIRKETDPYIQGENTTEV